MKTKQGKNKAISEIWYNEENYRSKQFEMKSDLRCYHDDQRRSCTCYKCSISDKSVCQECIENSRYSKIKIKLIKIVTDKE